MRESEENRREWTGRAAMERLAETYQQLYLRPGEEGAKEYSQIVRNGAEAQNKDLSHFVCSEEDRLSLEDTPAGGLQVLWLHDRGDFELFIKIMAKKCVPGEVPATQGAAILDGLINWPKIHRHQEEFMAQEREKGNPSPDWPAEFRRFTLVKSNFKDALIVLSNGPYSNIPAEKVGMSEKEWIERSYIIRKTHECTHFICRRLYPEKINAIWDELVADAAGIYAAFGSFRLDMEEIFLGITEGRYTGGRLQNYAGEKSTEELAELVHKTLLSFERVFAEQPFDTPFRAALALEERKEALWDIYF